MLRCPPSRITLTPSDIADFEHRLGTRQLARRSKARVANVRLSPGPAHSTRLSFVPAEENISRNRAASSSSEATIHDTNTDPSPIEQNATESQCDPLGQTIAAFNAALWQRPALAESSPRRQVDSFYGTEQVLDFQTRNDGNPTTTPTVDGTAGVDHPAPAQVSYTVPWTPRGNELLGEIHSDAYPATRQQPTEPPLLASARARRRQAKSQDVHLFRDDDSTQRRILRTHGGASSGETRFVPPVPELILPPDHVHHSNDLTLDPGAPVFVPRMRFGTPAGSSESTHVPDTSHNPSNLRIRPSSERNAGGPIRDVNRSLRSNVTYGSVAAHELARTAPGRRPRRRSRTTDQNIALSHITPTLERYPLLRPAPNADVRQYSDNLPGPGFDYVPGVLEEQVSSYYQEVDTSATQEQARLRVVNPPTSGRSTRGDEGGRTRSVSPAISMSSRSTPNLFDYAAPTPLFTVRGSSLPWNRIDARTPSCHGVPSMVSAQQVSRQSSTEGLLDAATEFLRMRNSPLDELTERISRMSASRLRSVGRSWERPPRPRTSLLTGDAFRPGPNAISISSTFMTTIEPELSSLPLVHVEETVPTPEDIVALAIALPPSSPMASTSDGLPSTPSLHFSESRIAPSTLDGTHAAKSPDSSTKRKPVPASTATPKVPVYDDSKPPSTQPQTPADIRGSTRRTKTRSDTTVQQPPIFIGRVMMSSPPAIPERHPHRNTYPSTASAQSNRGTTMSMSSISLTAAPQNVPEVNRHNHNSRRERVHRGSGQAENDMVEAHLQGLEEDRRTWLNRREDGTMDVTPPREGRFERYLS